MKIVVIPEDFTHDRHILKPLFERLLRYIGKGHARIVVCQSPRLGGVDAALKTERLGNIVKRYAGMAGMFILCIDRDGDKGRRQRLDQIEAELGKDSRVFLAENAWEEIETWVLAGLNLPKGWRWRDVRAEVQVKERYFDEFARRRGVADGPGGGRKALGEEAARNVAAIRRKCREDFDALAQRIEAAPP